MKLSESLLDCLSFLIGSCCFVSCCLLLFVVMLEIEMETIKLSDFQNHRLRALVLLFL